MDDDEPKSRLDLLKSVKDDPRVKPTPSTRPWHLFAWEGGRLSFGWDEHGLLTYVPRDPPKAQARPQPLTWEAIAEFEAEWGATDDVALARRYLDRQESGKPTARKYLTDCRGTAWINGICNQCGETEHRTISAFEAGYDDV